jgi:hypothetical protein
METSLEELTRGYPSEFKEFMEYCRQLKFEEEPDYKHCVGMFEKCLAKNNLDSKILDFTWKQNRLSKDKEALKNSVLNVIKRKPKAADNTKGENQQAEDVRLLMFHQSINRMQMQI